MGDRTSGHGPGLGWSGGSQRWVCHDRKSPIAEPFPPPPCYAEVPPLGSGSSPPPTTRSLMLGAKGGAKTLGAGRGCTLRGWGLGSKGRARPKGMCLPKSCGECQRVTDSPLRGWQLPWENPASQAGWASLGSTVTPGTGWLPGTPTSPSQPMSRLAWAVEGCGLVQGDHLAGARWQSSQLGLLTPVPGVPRRGIGAGPCCSVLGPLRPWIPGDEFLTVRTSGSKRECVRSQRASSLLPGPCSPPTACRHGLPRLCGTPEQRFAAFLVAQHTS